MLLAAAEAQLVAAVEARGEDLREGVAWAAALVATSEAAATRGARRRVAVRIGKILPQATSVAGTISSPFRRMKTHTHICYAGA